MSLDFKGLLGSSEGVGLAGGAGASAMGIDGLFPSLSLKQRVIAFCCCFGVGMVISFMSTISLWSGNMTQFAVLYSFGNIVALLSTSFLFGPLRQIKNMFAKKRAIATIIYLAALIGTLIVAFTVKSVALVIVMIIIQFLALVWYTLSYIPFARDAVCNMFKGCFRG